jgi:nitronate monooxygenase
VPGAAALTAAGWAMMEYMALRTAFTDMFSLQHPIALAPMGGASGGALAAAVSEAGGLGLIGGGRSDLSWLEPELAIAAGRTRRPWGVGFQCWATDVSVVERALSYRPAAVMLSFGDPRPLAGAVRAAGAALIVQVVNLAEARQAVEIGADVIVAQGTEGGGHGGRRSTLPFVPVVVDLAAPAPVLAAGGIADGRGPRRSRWAPPGRCSGPGSWSHSRRWGRPAWPSRSSRAAVRTPRAAGCPTSRAGRRGQASTRHGPSGTHSSISGWAGRTSSPPTRMRCRRTGTP